MEKDQLENRMRVAEHVLERQGAVPLDINQKNRELLGQRVTYRLGGVYYRIDHAEIEGKTFIILSATESKEYAGIGLMDDIQAISADAGDETIRRKLLEAMA